MPGQMHQNAQRLRKRRSRIWDIGRVVCDQGAETTGIGRFEIIIETEGGGFTEGFLMSAGSVEWAGRLTDNGIVLPNA